MEKELEKIPSKEILETYDKIKKFVDFLEKEEKNARKMGEE